MIEVSCTVAQEQATNLAASDWIALVNLVIATLLGAIAIIQSWAYKRQADIFCDLQYMPEIYRVGNWTSPEYPKAGRELLEGMENSRPTLLGVFLVKGAPLYDLQICAVYVDNHAQKVFPNKIDVSPCEPYFYLEPNIPSITFDDELSHSILLRLTYKNQYDTQYQKEITFDFENNRPKNVKLSRARRAKK